MLPVCTTHCSPSCFFKSGHLTTWTSSAGSLGGQHQQNTEICIRAHIPRWLCPFLFNEVRRILLKMYRRRRRIRDDAYINKAASDLDGFLGHPSAIAPIRIGIWTQMMRKEDMDKDCGQEQMEVLLRAAYHAHLIYRHSKARKTHQR